VKRGGGQLVFTASKPPKELLGIEDRLRSRLESGLVIDLSPAEQTAAEHHAVVEHAAASEPEAPHTADTDDLLAAWFLARDKVLWDWPNRDDSLIFELS
jgi:chromosomal replication initiation ATPase DnaA